MPVDLDNQLAANLAAIAQQGVADNQKDARRQGSLDRWQHMVYVKNEVEAGIQENPALFASLNSADRTPVVKIEKP